MTPGRNDPCPCGSGLKYKKCHFPREVQRPAQEPMGSLLHDRDLRFVDRVGRWIHARSPVEFEEAGHIMGSLEGHQGSLPFLIRWSVYHHQIRGLPAFEWFAREEADALSPSEREWIDAQRLVWLGMWEVLETVPGKSMIIADLLSGEKRLVQETITSRMVVARDVLMARVADLGNESILSGIYPIPLSPEEGARAAAALRRVMRVKASMPVETLREFDTALMVIGTWQAVVDEHRKREEMPARIENTDGDPVRLTSDRYRFAPADRASVEAAVGSLRGAMPIDEEDDGVTRTILFVKSGAPVPAGWKNAAIAAVFTTERELRIETSSTRRSNALRKRVEKATAGMLADHRRTQRDPLADVAAAARHGGPPILNGAPMPPEVEAMIVEQKTSYYESWLDMSIPALGGKTPRKAVRSRDGHEALVVVLKGIENREARETPGTRYDVRILRRALKIED